MCAGAGRGKFLYVGMEKLRWEKLKISRNPLKHERYSSLILSCILSALTVMCMCAFCFTCFTFKSHSFFLSFLNWSNFFLKFLQLLFLVYKFACVGFNSLIFYSSGSVYFRALFLLTFVKKKKWFIFSN